MGCYLPGPLVGLSTWNLITLLFLGTTLIAAIERSRRELSGALFHVFSAQQEVIFLEPAHIDHFVAYRLGAL